MPLPEPEPESALTQDASADIPTAAEREPSEKPEQPFVAKEPVKKAAKKEVRKAAKKATKKAEREAVKKPEKSKKLSKEQAFQKVHYQTCVILSIVFFAVVMAITIFLLAAPRTVSSQIERRGLSQWPSLTAAGVFDGSYARDITQFYNDSVPARDTFKNIGKQIRSLFGISIGGTAQLVSSTYNAPETMDPETDISEENGSDLDSASAGEDLVSSKDYHIENEDVIAENGYLVVLQDGHWRAFSFYNGADINLYANTINYVRQMVDPSVNIYVMPAPLACQFYIPANYLDYHEDMDLTFRDLSSKLGSGITAINIINDLNEHNTELIYLRTDHHWAHLGAYYAASAFAQQAEVPFAELDSYEKVIREDYVGTMYALTGSANLLNDPEDFVYYIPTNSYIADYFDPDMTYQFRKGLFFDTSLSDSYAVALGEDDQIIRITTDAGNGRKLLVIKDSFGNAAVPFLTSSFEEIYVIDQRYFNLNLIDYIHSIGVTDILFLHDYYSLTGSEAELLEYITYSNLDSKSRDAVPKPELPSEGNPDTNSSEILFAQDVPGYKPPPADESGEDATDDSVNNLVHEIYDASFYENHEETGAEETDADGYEDENNEES